MNDAESEALFGEEITREHRIQVTSKKRVIDQIGRYKDILKRALDGQSEVEEKTKQVLLQELLAVGQSVSMILTEHIGFV